MATETVEPECATTTSGLLSLTLIERKADLDAMGRPDAKWIAETTAGGVTYGLFHRDGSLWVRARFGEGAGIAFCVAYAFGAPTRIVNVEPQAPNGWRIRMHTLAGEYHVQVELPDKAHPVLHWRTTLRPSSELRVQSWPRDVIPIGACGSSAGTAGTIHAAQKGITGNVLFVSLTEPDELARGSFLYVQNLGALTDYFEQTKGSAFERVGGTWPELGFELPPTTDNPLQPALEYVLSDAYVCFSTQIPRNDVDMGRLFLDLYACAYLSIPGDDVPQTLRVLLPEYCKYLVDRAWFHYPSELPSDVLADKPQSGNLHRYLSVPVEDLYEGWQRAGQVGQEVYGASAPFIIATRHCHQVPGEQFIVHCTYPLTWTEMKRDGRGGHFRFRLTGDKRCEAFIRIIAENFGALPRFEVVRLDGKTQKKVEPELTPLGYLEYVTPGDAELEVRWDKSEMFIGGTLVPDRIVEQKPSHGGKPNAGKGPAKRNGTFRAKLAKAKKK